MDIWGVPEMEVPQHGRSYFMENPIRIRMDLGVPLFQETSILRGCNVTICFHKGTVECHKVPDLHQGNALIDDHLCVLI